MLHIEMLQAAVAGIVEENHNEHHLGLGERAGTMIRPFPGILDGIFCHHGIKKLAKIIGHTEYFYNFVIGKHSGNCCKRYD